MQWLILTENQEKAAAMRRGAPADATCMSTRGIPWDIKVEISDRLSYHTYVQNGHTDLLARIQNIGDEADRILLAFDPTSSGEAAARGFEDLFGRNKCVRWPAPSLNPNDIKRALTTFETQNPKDTPKTNQGLAACHWCKTAMDVAWTHKVSHWLEVKTKRQERMSRLMAGLLRTISEESRKKEIFQKKTYWEISSTLKKTQGAGTWVGSVIVPTFAQLGGGAPSRTREIWRKRTEEARTQAMNGTGLPQPEPGKPWRFLTWEDVSIQKTHMKKFPYFVVETVNETDREQEIRPPLTYTTLIALAAKTNKGTPEKVHNALTQLYHAGVITQPKTENPNLHKKTVEGLYLYGQSKGVKMQREAREFMEETNRSKTTEALHPTNWSRTPDELASLLPEETHRDLKAWIYRVIYQRAFNSQVEKPPTPVNKAYLVGPLYLTKKGAQERNVSGKPFKIEKENKYQAHMNVILCIEEENPSQDFPQAGESLECTGTEIHERVTEAPPILTEEGLFHLMTSGGFGKRGRLQELVELLKKANCVHTNAQGEINLTEQGKSLIALLNNNFGQFLDKNYHKTVAENLRAIEENRQEAEEFLSDWWSCFQTFIEDDMEPETSTLWQKSAAG